MDESVKAYLLSQGCYEFTLGGYPSRDTSNNEYNIFYGIKRKIGCGGFGVVHLADRYVAKPDGIRKDPTWPECAVKVLTLPSSADPRAKEMTERIKRELEFNSIDRWHIKKNVVIPIRVHISQNQPPLIVMEYCPGGDLARYLSTCQQRRVSERLAKRIILQVCSGLKEIRDEGFFHRDVKPANVFITNQTSDETKMNFKIGDFGLVAKIGEDHRVLCGTPASIAPEINGKTLYGPEVDVWSLGVLLYTILTGQVPFRGENDFDTIRKVRESLHHFPDPTFCYISEHAKDLINRMLQKDPRRRISLDDVMKHPFLCDYPYRTTSFQTSVFSSDSGFSSSNASASLGGSPALRSANFLPGKLQAVFESDVEKLYSRKNFPKNSQSSPNSGPVVASLRFENDLFAKSQSCNPPSLDQFQHFNFGPHNLHTNRFASSAPSLATNLSTASLGQVTGSDPCVGHKQLVKLAPPLSTTRLRPSSKKHHFKIGSGLIQPDGQVLLEFNIPKRDFQTEAVIESMLISADGQKIQVSRTHSPEFGTRNWPYNELPSKYWSKYNYAVRFVNLVRESTPKITVYTDNAVYKLMENDPPDGNFEVQFYSGEKLTFLAKKGTWSSTISGLQDPTKHPEFRSLQIEHERIKHLEKMMEQLELEESKLPGKRYSKFPLMMGKRPASVSSLPQISKHPSLPNLQRPSSPANFKLGLN